MPFLGSFFDQKLMPKGNDHSFLALLSLLHVSIVQVNLVTAYSECELILIKLRIICCNASYFWDKLIKFISKYRCACKHAHCEDLHFCRPTNTLLLCNKVLSNPRIFLCTFYSVPPQSSSGLCLSNENQRKNNQTRSSRPVKCYLMITMMLSNMLYGFLMYPNKPKASSMKPISRTNMLVKTMLLISNTSVNSSGWGEERKRARDRGGEELISVIYSIPRSRAPLRRHVRAAVRCNQPVN